MPDLMVCTPSVTNPEKFIEVEHDQPSARLGTAIHDFAQRIVETGEYSIRDINARYPDDAARIAVLVDNFAKVWRTARPRMPKPQTELAFSVQLSEEVTLTGHIDLAQIDPTTALILDYKTGRIHDNHYHQVAAYAFGAWDKAGRPDNYTVSVCVVYLEDLNVSNYDFDSDSLKRWRGEVLDKLKDLRYTVSRKCAFCSIQGSCPAYKEYMRSAMAYFSSTDALPMKAKWSDDPAERGKFMDRLYVLKKGIQNVERALQFWMVGKHLSELDMGDGTVYTQVAHKEEVLKPVKALPVLKERFDRDLLEAIAVYPLSKVLELIAKFAPTGKKLKSRAEFKDKLIAADAIGVTKRYWYERRPKNEGTLTEEKTDE